MIVDSFKEQYYYLEGTFNLIIIYINTCFELLQSLLEHVHIKIYTQYYLLAKKITRFVKCLLKSILFCTKRKRCSL